MTDLSTPDNAQARTVAEIIQRSRPDVLLVNEFDYVAGGEAAELFRENYLEVSQNGARPVDYPYYYVAESNTGIPSGFDLNNNGTVGGGDDAFGFGAYPGQFGLAVFSKYPIDTRKARTFQHFLWKDMPGAMLPDDPATPAPADWYSPEELDVFRLSSKSHWDLPIRIGRETVHFLVSHPTPPVFDGAEDRNGTRNFDEIRFWADYVRGGKRAAYIYDDEGRYGGLRHGEQFVIAGDQNSDPLDGDSVPGAIQQLLDNPKVNAKHPPTSAGAVEASELQPGNETHEQPVEVRHRRLRRAAGQPARRLRAPEQGHPDQGLGGVLAGPGGPAVPADRGVPVPVQRPPAGVGGRARPAAADHPVGAAPYVGDVAVKKELEELVVRRRRRVARLVGEPPRDLAGRLARGRQEGRRRHRPDPGPRARRGALLRLDRRAGAQPRRRQLLAADDPARPAQHVVGDQRRARRAARAARAGCSRPGGPRSTPRRPTAAGTRRTPDPPTAEVPADLAAAIAADPDAQAMFEVLTSSNRFALVHRLRAVKREETRARKIREFVAMLARGETPYPQKAKPRSMSSGARRVSMGATREIHAPADRWETPVSTPTLTSLMLSSTDPQRLHDWYTTALPPQTDDKQDQYRILGYGGFYLFLDSRDDVGRARPPSPAGWSSTSTSTTPARSRPGSTTSAPPGWRRSRTATAACSRPRSTPTATTSR